MKTKTHVALALGFFFGLIGAAWSEPTVLANMIRLHGQDESTFPTASAATRGAILFGTDAGVPYWSDGGTWTPITTSAGSVTNFSVVTANGVSASVANSTSTPAATFTLGNITPSKVTVSATTGTDAVKMLDGARITFSTSDTNASLYRWSTDIIATDGVLASLGSLSLLSNSGTFVARTLGDACFSVAPSLATVSLNSGITTTFIGNYIKPEANSTLSIGGGRIANGSIADSSLAHTSGFAPLVTEVFSFAPASGSGSSAGIQINPTVNGVSSGTFTGLVVAQKTNTLTGGTINLMDLGTTTGDYGTGFTSKFRVAIDGTVTAASSILPATANGPDLGSAGSYWGNVFAGGFWSKVPATNNAVAMLDGARVNFSTADSNAYLYRPSANTIYTPGQLGGSVVYAAEFNVGAAASGAYIEPAYYSGYYSIMMRGNADNGAGKASVWIGATTALAETEDLLALVNSPSSGGARKFAVKPSGKVGQAGTDGSATAGAQTIDKPVGKGKIASGATTVVITNALCASGSIVFISWEGDHGAARSWVVPGSGSFTVNLSGAASGDTVFSFEVKDIR